MSGGRSGTGGGPTGAGGTAPLAFYESALLASVRGVRHAFGTRAQPVPEPFAAEWAARKPRWSQVHGTACAEASACGQELGAVDAVHSAARGVPVGVVTADCVPILLARRDGGRVAAAHAGWRGTRARILKALWGELSARHGERPADWVAAIGPAIGPCCYEVSEELARDFAAEFAAAGAGVAVPRRRILDLQTVNAFQLRELGFAPEAIDVIRACTRCLEGPGGPVFHSYRREGGGTRQYHLIEATG